MACNPICRIFIWGGTSHNRGGLAPQCPPRGDAHDEKTYRPTKWRKRKAKRLYSIQFELNYSGNTTYTRPIEIDVGINRFEWRNECVVFDSAHLITQCTLVTSHVPCLAANLLTSLSVSNFISFHVLIIVFSFLHGISHWYIMTMQTHTTLVTDERVQSKANKQ